MTEYNVNDLFPEVNTFDKSLLFVEEKNNKAFFALMTPSDYKGTIAAARPVQGYYKGQPNKAKSFIVRCLFFPDAKDLSNFSPVGLVVNQYVASKLAETFKPNDNPLVTQPHLLPKDGKIYLFNLKKQDKKTEVIFSNFAVVVDPEALNQEFKSFEELISEFDSMQQAILNKGKVEEEADTPF